MDMKGLFSMQELYEVSKKWIEISESDFETFYEYYKNFPTLPIGTAGSEKCIDMLTSKWKFPILIRLLKHEYLRYSEIKNELRESGITNYMLTKSLKELENDKLILKTVYPEVPPHTEYQVTDKAKELLIIFIRMTNWYSKYELLELEDD
ncbi:MAG: winged helix-turn-helix transcriptional regulator [Eubacteriales bacterium]